MRVSSAALFTLASVTTGTNVGQAIATPTSNNLSTGETAKNIVVPTTTSAPATIQANITPETTNFPQFSQKPVTLQSRGGNNSPVVVETVPVNQGRNQGRNQGINQSVNQLESDRVVEFSVNVPNASSTTAPAPIKIPVPKPGQTAKPSPRTNIASNEPARIKITVPKPGQTNTNKTNTNKTNTNKTPPNSVVIPVTQNPSRPVGNSNPNSNPRTNNNSDLVVPAADVQIRGGNPELDKIIRQVIKTQVGGDTNQSQLQQDVAAILDTGLFRNARFTSNTNSQGLLVTFQVEPVIVNSFQLSGGKILDQKTALEPFQNLIGKPISPEALKKGVEKTNKWYRDRGYSLARVISITPTPNGVLTMNVAEGVVNEIQFKFLSEDGKEVDSKGKPVTGRTKPEFLRKQLAIKSGDVLKDEVVRQDLQKLYAMGLFESVNVRLDGDANKTNVIYELKETGARSINVGGNYNADQGIMGTLNYQDRNVGGVNDTLGVNVQLGRRDLLFDTVFKSPYRASEPNRIGYSIKTFRNRGLSETFDGDVKLANGDRVREGKIGASVSLERPIDGWDTSLGFNYTRVSSRDRDGNIVPFDELGNQLTFSNTGIDDLTTVSFSAVKDRRDNPLFPTSGSLVKLSTEQSLPFGNGDISMNRLQANYIQYTPVQVFKSEKPQVFALNLQAGTVLGDLPPYEAFNLGGPNSVRGFGAGDVGTGRTYVLASAEYRFPILSMLGGVLFADFASDLGSGDSVPGNPAGVRGKPGTGFGYGAGVRVDSPLGVIRADYGLSSEGESRLHFGLGQSF